MSAGRTPPLVRLSVGKSGGMPARSPTLRMRYGSGLRAARARAGHCRRVVVVVIHRLGAKHTRAVVADGGPQTRVEAAWVHGSLLRGPPGTRLRSNLTAVHGSRCMLADVPRLARGPARQRGGVVSIGRAALQ